MTFKRIVFISGLIVCTLADTGCNKWLDLKPVDGIIKQEYWKKKEDLSAAVIGAYTSLIAAPPGTSDTPIELSIFLWGELRADMVVPTEASTTQEQKDIKDIVSVNITPLNTLLKWSAFYRTINYCNDVLANADAVRANDPTLTEAQMNGFKGEMLALRSLMYFYLVRTFRDVPLKLSPTAKDSDLADIGKTPEKDILAQLVKDLKQAEEWAPAATSDLPNSKLRISKLGVYAILADVYLWMEDYANCIIECNKVTDYAAANPTLLKLVPPTNLWWNLVFETGNSTETIFAFDHQIQVPNPFGTFLIGISQRLKASPNIIGDVFPPDDSDVNNVIPDDVRRGEFYNPDNGDIRRHAISTISTNDFQVYRLSDVMLMKAEALALTGQGPEAYQIVADLRLARNAEKTTNPGFVPTDAAAVASYILEERRREFAFEGKRWFDIIRYAKRGNFANKDLLISIVSGLVSGSSIESVRAKYQDVDSWYLPINQADLFADQTLVQNPFYDK